MFSVRTVRLAYNPVYLVEGPGGSVLVDAGPDYRDARETLLRELAGTIPETVVATHAHSDHAGLGHWWQERGAKVAIGSADARLVRGPHFADSGEFVAFAAYIRASGAPDNLQQDLLRGLEGRRTWVDRAARPGYPPARPSDRWPTGLRFDPFEPDTLVADGDVVAALRVVACPGHTPGNLVLAAEEDGLLFSGDQLLPDITPTPGIQFVPAESGEWLRFPSLPPFVESLERLQARSFSRCYPGHGEPFDNVTGTIGQNLAQLEQRTDRLMGELRAAGEATVHRLSERLYPRALNRRWWQIVATIQGHLDLLAARGRAAEDHGTWRPKP